MHWEGQNGSSVYQYIGGASLTHIEIFVHVCVWKWSFRSVADHRVAGANGGGVGVGWWCCINQDGRRGFVPANRLRMLHRFDRTTSPQVYSTMVPFYHSWKNKADKETFKMCETFSQKTALVGNSRQWFLIYPLQPVSSSSSVLPSFCWCTRSFSWVAGGGSALSTTPSYIDHHQSLLSSRNEVVY